MNVRRSSAIERASWHAADLVLAASVSYLAFALIAYLFFPLSFSPGANWLSDLGSRVLNPDGSIAYRFGCALTGALLIAFFLDLTSWLARVTSGPRWPRLALQGCGVLAGVALILTAVFPIDQFGTHQFWSRVLYVSLGTAVAFSIIILWQRLPTPVLVVGVLTWAVDIASAVASHTTWLEWVVVGFILIYLNLIGVSSRLDRPAGARGSP